VPERKALLMDDPHEYRRAADNIPDERPL